jgi:anti-sigma regulatory factor (Ser/Thr protein kinase)
MTDRQPIPLVMVRRLTTDEDAPRAARLLVAEVLERLAGAGDDRRDDLALVVSEMVSNAVLHGPPGEVELRIIGTSGLIRIEVSDGGVLPFQRITTDGNRGHWGLGLIEEFSDRYAIVQDPATLVWCEFDIA